MTAHMKSTAPEPESPLSPLACPFCQSAKIRAASVKADSSAYWRCEACGQMWNVGRLKASHRPQFGGRWNNGY